MKTLQDLKTSITEAVDPARQRFDMLVRAGLMDKTQLPKLHRVLDKMSQDQTLGTAERQLVIDLLGQLTNIVTSNLGVFQKVRQAVKAEGIEESIDMGGQAMYHQEPPPLLVMRRKALRAYPNDLKVALYYNDKLDRYFSVPYQDNSGASSE